MPGQDFERSIVHAFNDYSTNYAVPLIAYRHLQFIYNPQLFDVLVDGLGLSRYLALECKSIDANDLDRLYFKKHFSWTKGVCQVERESAWLKLSGRFGFLVFEARAGRGQRTSSYFVPWSVISTAFYEGENGVKAEVIQSYPKIDKQGGKYVFDDQFMREIEPCMDTSEVRKVLNK
mgnify:CR=1 FL=1